MSTEMFDVDRLRGVNSHLAYMVSVMTGKSTLALLQRSRTSSLQLAVLSKFAPNLAAFFPAFI